MMTVSANKTLRTFGLNLTCRFKGSTSSRRSRVNLVSTAAVKGRMDNLLQDVRYGLRTLLRQPGFAATAILTLALGIGATTAIFSVVNAVVLRPMPFDEPDRVMVVTNMNLKTGTRNTTISGPDFFDWRAQARGFEVLSYFTGSWRGQRHRQQRVGLHDRDARRARVLPGVRRDGADGPSVHARRGAGPATSDAVVISEAYWRRQFGSDPRAIGSTITVRPAHEARLSA